MTKFKWYINYDAMGYKDHEIVVEKYYADKSEYGVEYISFKSEEEAENYIKRKNYE
tara:strand:+ start:129 stop:296 length:168 start_codon:yes stop_codon:yes gene_type:complete